MKTGQESSSQISGNTDKEIVELRIEMINRFLKKLSKIDYLFNSDEMNYFLENSTNVSKTLENIKVSSYSDLLTRGKTDQENFYKNLCAIYPKLKTFRNFIFQEKERFRSVQQNYIAVINMLSLYEKEIINTFVNNDENKLVFFNMKNIDLCKSISNAQEKSINPYDRLYESITEDYLDTEAMQEALESLKNLQDNYNKLTKNLTSINVQLNDLQSGKTNVKNLMRLKSKEDNVSSLMLEKEKSEKDIDCLGQIIKIATFNMQNEIKKFKLISLDNYYNELSRIEKDTEINARIFDDLWETVVKDKNIAEYN